jgi:hypothetical protein
MAASTDRAGCPDPDSGGSPPRTPPEIRRAEVIGQILPGLVSVLRPVEAAPEVVGVPKVVFAANVGGDDALAHVIEVLRGRMEKPG